MHDESDLIDIKIFALNFKDWSWNLTTIGT